ncbi:relaxase/mobilization nuclease domain-containing protein [Calothrix sp. UHCC 0171]|uniref:relaxase/mobilization nuclease domain-containing protein n=1 Tax=Calothrix sp. UHCC 0171 TaxID=3110245 RepID=UPI002B1EA0FE|nr:relaxase/mobilization nuclease domain-containing protein [Calothrix sp. UHCC 0171]MEA5574489.1 relaxase/mobilization nuclease domain-containing protein [Calothrix sp. UHCC 0171]
MIAKQRKGRGFRGLLEYVENKEEAERIGGNMSGQNPRELAAEFKFSWQLNPNVERAVYHVSLSLAPGEYLSDEQWNEISDRYLREMNFHNNQYVVYRHGDKENDHIHIVASRISLDDGRCVHDGWDYKRSEAIVRQLERDYNLESVRGSHEKLERTATTGQHRRIEREKGEYDLGLRDNSPELPVKMQLQKIIDGLCPVCDHRVTALKEHGSTNDQLTMPMFIERLQGEGVEVRHGFTRNGKSKGISYSFLGQAFSGSHLGAAYTFPGLQKHKGVSYQPQRDDVAIKQLLLNPINYGAATGFEQSDGFAIALAQTSEKQDDGLAIAIAQASEEPERERLRQIDTTADITNVIGSTDSKDSDDVTNTDSNEINANATDINNAQSTGNAADIINAQSIVEAVLIADDKNTNSNSQKSINSKNGSQNTIDISSTQNNASANTENREKDEAVSLPQQWQVIYQQICSKLEQFSDEERDYLIVKRLLQLKRSPSEIKEIINASPIEHTQASVKELMVRANLELLSEHQKQLRQQKKQSELEL